MIWFNKKKNKNISASPDDMTPLEVVTYLCASIQLSDGDVDYEERKVWMNAISLLFPEFSEKRADIFLQDAQIAINAKSNIERLDYVSKILERIKVLLTVDQIKLLGPKLAELIEADGIVMTSEMEIAKMVEKRLGISIIVDNDL